jgi:hypothetical protein
VLASEQQLETLKKYCKSVVVDSERSGTLADAPRRGCSTSARRCHPEKASVEQELGAARAAFANSHALIQEALPRYGSAARSTPSACAPRSRT